MGRLRFLLQEVCLAIMTNSRYSIYEQRPARVDLEWGWNKPWGSLVQDACASVDLLYEFRLRVSFGEILLEDRYEILKHYTLEISSAWALEPC